MSILQSGIYHGISGLAAIAAELDRLDRQSSERYDFSSAAIESYVRSFGAEEQFHIATVFEAGTLRAAFPFFTARHLGMFQIASSLANQWLPGRFLLLDPNLDSNDLLRDLCAHLSTAGVSTLEVDFVSQDAYGVNALKEWTVASGSTINVVPKFACGRIHLSNNWEQFVADWSKNRKKFIRKNERRLAEEGSLYLVAAHRSDLETAEYYFNECLKIEDRCWKGQQESSLLKNEMALSCFRDSMRLWHQTGRLQLYILKSNGRPIAFDFGFLKNRIASSIKISYLDNYATFSPGHVLNALVIRDMMAEGSVDWIDTMGTLTDANQKWCQSSYECQKLEIALPGILNHSRVQIRDWMRTIKRVAKFPKKPAANQPS